MFYTTVQLYSYILTENNKTQLGESLKVYGSFLHFFIFLIFFLLSLTNNIFSISKLVVVCLSVLSVFYFIYFIHLSIFLLLFLLFKFYFCLLFLLFSFFLFLYFIYLIILYVFEIRNASNNSGGSSSSDARPASGGSSWSSGASPPWYSLCLLEMHLTTDSVHQGVLDMHWNKAWIPHSSLFSNALSSQQNQSKWYKAEYQWTNFQIWHTKHCDFTEVLCMDLVSNPVDQGDFSARL